MVYGLVGSLDGPIIGFAIVITGCLFERDSVGSLGGALSSYPAFYTGVDETEVGFSKDCGVENDIEGGVDVG